MSNTSASAGTGSVQSVDRAVTILDLLGGCGELGVTEVAAELGVHKSTAFRLLATLERRDLVEQAEDRGKYRLGVGLLRLAGATTARLDVVQQARPIARQLAQDTGETVNIAVLSGNAALYIDQVAGASTLQPQNWVGKRNPLHATSNGKVLLAAMDPTQALDLLGTPTPYTEETLTSRKALRAELALVHEQGFALAVDELEEGLSAVAAPVRDARGDVVATLSVSGPTFRLTDERLDEAVTACVAAATDLSRRLGWHV